MSFLMNRNTEIERENHFVFENKRLRREAMWYAVKLVVSVNFNTWSLTLGQPCVILCNMKLFIMFASLSCTEDQLSSYWVLWAHWLTHPCEGWAFLWSKNKTCCRCSRIVQQRDWYECQRSFVASCKMIFWTHTQKETEEVQIHKSRKWKEVGKVWAMEDIVQGLLWRLTR